MEVIHQSPYSSSHGYVSLLASLTISLLMILHEQVFSYLNTTFVRLHVIYLVNASMCFHNSTF